MRFYLVCLAKVLVVEILQVWVLWEAVKSFYCVQWRQCQLAPTPISNSLVTDLRRGKNCCTAAADKEEELEYSREISLQPAVSVVLQVPEQRFPGNLWWEPRWWRPWWIKGVLAGQGGPQGRRDPPAAHGRPCGRTSECSETVALWEDSAVSGSWQACEERTSLWSRLADRPCGPMGGPCWSSLLLKDYTPWKWPTLEQLVKNFSPWEGSILEKLVEDYLLWKEPRAWAEECEDRPLVEEAVAEKRWDELTTASISSLSVLPWQGGREFYLLIKKAVV